MLRIIRQKGVVTLMLTIVILMIVTLTTLYTARVVQTDDKVFANIYRNNQAMGAARAGYDYALAYLNANVSTVTTGLSSCAVGNETYALSSGTLANNATYTMTYGCVTAASTTYLTITTVGTAADGSAVKTVTAMVKVLGGTSATPIVARSTVTNAGVVTNSLSGASYAINSGSTVSNSGTLTPNASNENNTSLSGLSDANFITEFMGNTFSFFSTYATSPYARISCTAAGTTTFTTASTYAALPTGCTLSASAGLSGSVLNNATGGVVYIDMTSAGSTLTFSNGASNNSDYAMGATTSASTRVILVVNFTGGGTTNFNVTSTANNNTDFINGNIYTNATNFVLDKPSGNANSTMTVNGLIVHAGTSSVSTTIRRTDTDGAVSLNGEVASAGTVTISASTTTTLDSTFLGYISGSHAGLVGTAATNGIGGAGASSYGLVAGSLKDF